MKEMRERVERMLSLLGCDNDRHSEEILNSAMGIREIACAFFL